MKVNIVRNAAKLAAKAIGGKMKRYIISSSFGSWSAGTVVELVKTNRNIATVRHVPTAKVFEIGFDKLVEKRNRGE
jgi:hypothetical protein